MSAEVGSYRDVDKEKRPLFRRGSSTKLQNQEHAAVAHLIKTRDSRAL